MTCRYFLPGKYRFTAVALSRTVDPAAKPDNTEEEGEKYVRMVTTILLVSSN